MNPEKEWFALMNKKGMFFESTKETIRWVNWKYKFRRGRMTRWVSCPYLRNKRATEIYLKKMQKIVGGKIVKFVIKK